MNAKPSAARVRVDDPGAESNPNQTSATGLANESSNFNMTANVAPEVAFLLNQKATQEDLEAVENQKANKQDTEALLVAQAVLSRQIKHLSTLFMECVRLQVENPSDSKISKENSKRYLLAQTRSLVNHWIIKFDPMSQNSTAKDDGLEYL